jgi:lysophospholipase L1-like esterase
MNYSNDWSNKNKYYLANIALKNQPNRNNRIVFIGDSITEFWGDKDPLFFESNVFINRGISGQTTTQILHRFIDDVVELHPKVVIILAGINDIAENSGPISLEAIFKNIVNMVRLAQENNIDVFLCSVLPANRFYWNIKIKPANKVVQLNQMLTKFASDNSIPFVDYYSKMVDRDKGLIAEYGKDAVHPNRFGYDVMKSIIMQYLSTLK